jgi:SAM-dependent methyltransferase
MLDGISSKSARDEEARIRAAYMRRQQDDRYSWFSPGHVFMTQEREQRLLALLKQHDFTSLSTKKILEIGCGTGYWLREFIKWGAQPEQIQGIDLLPDRVAEAKRLCPKAVTVQCGSAMALPFPNATFDLVFQFTVFTSILDSSMKQQIASEMLRVLRAGGLILWYDYHVNNPWNPDVQGIKKREIYQLFPGCRIELQRITLAPPFARWFSRRSWTFAHLLGKIPFLCTHYLGVIHS